jgi:large subunit ribosomal protein L14
MIQRMTRLLACDNSGAKQVMCIGMLGKPTTVARAGRVISVTVKSARPNGKVQAGTVHRALVVRCAKETPRGDGRWVRFGDNACVLLGPDGRTPLGTRVFGPVSADLYSRCISGGGDWLKVLSLASRVI